MRLTIERLEEIENAREILKREGYFVNNLWHIDDVKTFYKCNDEQAMEVLDHVLNGNDCVTDSIWRMIDIITDGLNIEKKDEILL